MTSPDYFSMIFAPGMSI